MRRGIWETTGLYAESVEPGWLAITCDSPTMAAWMCAAIILENVDARVDEDRLVLPAGPDYRLKDEVKSIITVVAKTHHYWQAHVAGRVARDVSDGDALSVPLHRRAGSSSRSRGRRATRPRRPRARPTARAAERIFTAPAMNFNRPDAPTAARRRRRAASRTTATRTGPGTGHHSH